MKAVKQCIGIDCAKKDFMVTFSIADRTQSVEHVTTHKFLMNPAGFKAFVKWVDKHSKHSAPMVMVMESTGVYHEKLCNFLYDLKYSVALVNPRRAKDFSKTLQVKKVTDKIASRYLATMGLEKKLDLWEKPQRVYRDLRVLTRESEQIQQKITMIKNELEAEEYRQVENQNSVKRLNAELELLKQHKTQVWQEVKEMINANPQLKARIEKVTSIPGVGLQTAATLAAETQGFSQTRNKRQLVSYCGLDIINQESGTSVWTKPRISKRGNRHIRKALYMPALTSIRHGDNKQLFIRIVSKTGIKMKGVVAAQRKLLILIYTLWKNDSVYDREYEAKKEGDTRSPQELDLIRS